jgi:hypothetical protein
MSIGGGECGRNLLTHTRMSTFKTCPRKHYFRYVLGIERDRDSAPQNFGKNSHFGLDQRNQGIALDSIAYSIRCRYAIIPDWITTDEDRQKWDVEEEQVVRMLYGYDWRWKNDSYEVLATEQTFNLPIRNPATGRASTIVRVAGKIDKIVRLPDGRCALVEHKTTGDSIESPDADFWKRVRLDHQVTLYFWAARELGYEVETIIYDAIHKPGMEPFKATPAEKRKYKKDGKLYANQREHNEPIEQYGERLTNDIGKRPDFYFRREEVPRLESDVAEFLDELWQQQKAIQQARLHRRHYRNPAACIHPYRCQFLDICQGAGGCADGVPDGYRKLDYLHPELLENENEPATDSAAGAPAAPVEGEQSAFANGIYYGPETSAARTDSRAAANHH